MKVRAAGLFLVNKENKILVGHPTHHDPNFWSIPKGKIDGDETPLEAAIRETYEETNVKLFKDLHNFIEIGKYVYHHKKKDIVLFVTFEPERASWDQINIYCNSNVPEERSGFPEMDGFKWVTIDEARTILHKTQVDALDILEEKIDNHNDEVAGKYPILWCDDCLDFVHHRDKLSAVISGNRVCNTCNRMNPVCTLIKDIDEAPNYFMKNSNAVLWAEFNEDKTLKARHDEPAVGRCLIMSPFSAMFTWQTTPITEILEVNNDKLRKYIKFKTENTIYKLYYHKL